MMADDADPVWWERDGVVGSWAGRHGENANWKDMEEVEQYLVAMYWAITTVTTVGYRP